MLIDYAVARSTDGALTFDRDGALAAQGAWMLSCWRVDARTLSQTSAAQDHRRELFGVNSAHMCGIRPNRAADRFQETAQATMTSLPP